MFDFLESENGRVQKEVVQQFWKYCRSKIRDVCFSIKPKGFSIDEQVANKRFYRVKSVVFCILIAGKKILKHCMKSENREGKSTSSAIFSNTFNQKRLMPR